MLVVKICIGSSCYLKGAQELVDEFRNAVKKNNAEDKIELSGSFCTGRCNRGGVTVQVNDTVYTGITKENFNDFFNDYVLREIEGEYHG